MIDVSTEGRAIARALKSMKAKAKAAGIKNPKIFFESEAQRVYLIDGDHPGDLSGNMMERQEAVVADAIIGVFGVGAW